MQGVADPLTARAGPHPWSGPAVTKLEDPLSRECPLCSARVQGWGKGTKAETQSREPRETGERVPDSRGRAPTPGRAPFPRVPSRPPPLRRAHR